MTLFQVVCNFPESRGQYYKIFMASKMPFAPLKTHSLQIRGCNTKVGNINCGSISDLV